MWKLLFVLTLGLVWQNAECARRIQASELVRQTMAKRSAEEGLPTIHELLQLNENEDVDAVRSMVTAKKTQKTRYTETYKGIPIYDSVITADDQDIHDVHGVVVQEIHQDLDDVTPAINPDDALDIIKKAEGDSEVENAETNLFVYVGDDEKARLMYQASYVAENREEPSRPVYLIDAKSGEVIDHWEGLTSHQMSGVGGNNKIGKYYYGSNYGYLQVYRNGWCYLENNNVKVVHMNFRKSGSSSSHAVDCSTGANDGINGAYSPAHDGLYFGGIVFNMYQQWYGINPLSQQLVVRVHYGRRFENAFWDGRQMTFGDGASYMHPLVSLDVMAHEVSHGVTQFNSNLEYRSQSGGINEAFSDMAGETAEYFMRGSNDWKIGYDIIKGSGAMRYMNNPPSDGRSIGHTKDYYEGIDVHFSSGIFNKAFYSMAVSSDFNVKTAFHVMLQANRFYWSSKTNFANGACGVVRAARDLGYRTTSVVNAFWGVGIDARSC